MLFEIESFFIEQQEVMNLPDEDISDYLARRRRSKMSSIYGFSPNTIIAPDAGIPPPVGDSSAVSPDNQRTTATPDFSHVEEEIPRYSETSQRRSATPQQSGILLDAYPPVRQPSTTPVQAGSKRPGDEHPGNHRMPKKSRRDDIGIVTAAADASQASPDRTPPECAVILQPLTTEDAADIGAHNCTSTSHHCASECTSDILVDTRHPACSAELAPSRAISENARDSMRLDAVGEGHAMPSSEPRQSALPVDPSVSHQGKRRRSEPELPVPLLLNAPIAATSLASNRRATVGDCSEITSPPKSAPSAPSPSVPQAGPSSAVSGTRTARNAAKRVSGKPTVRGGKGRKKEKVLYTPLEYAQKLQAQLSEQAAGKKKQSDKPFLKGKRIFYYGGDLNYASGQTRNRMEIITRHGGTLVPKYDPAEITHIVTDADERVFLRAIGLKKLSDIPQHIPTVRWSWVLSGFDRAPIRRSTPGIDKGKAPEKNTAQEFAGKANGQDDSECEYPMDYEFEHAAYRARIDAGRTPWGEIARLKAEQEAKRNHSSTKVPDNSSRGTGPPAAFCQGVDDVSNISDFTQDIEPPRDAATITPIEGLPSPPSSPNVSRSGPAQALKSHNAAGDTRAVRTASGSSRWNDAAATGAASKARSIATTGGSSLDPLAEFYATARAERDAEMLPDGGPDSGSAAIPGKGPNHVRREVVKKGFVCDDKGGAHRLTACPNQDVIDKLQELKTLHAAKPTKDDEWRVMSYNKAIAALRKHPSRIRSYEEAKTLRGIGDKTAQKIMEIIETGNLRRIEHERTEDVAAIQLFQGIYGVGANTAVKWYNNGCRTLEDVAAQKGGIKLSTEQMIGLKYYKDINTRIPRAEVAEIYGKIKAIALQIDPKLFIEIMGSFRRGKADCGDIDVLITRPTDDGKTHQGVLRRLLRELHQEGIVTEDLCLPDDFDDLELVYRGLCRRDSQSLRRRIDFLTVPWTSRGAALLYYTGDDIFNRSLRLKANKMGYSLNQRGLYAGVVRNPSDKRQKLNDGQLIASESEREILDILGVPWQEPHERVRG
ncbi:hypothetical protein GY45DRAFT_1330494 [Cubamyces sp. BRFM 1775]|nr:hypothetical protein GY45DRAFT_1330494 [Cubamyces sp. BRFM 1775]